MPKSTYADVHLEVEPDRPQTQLDKSQVRPDRETPFRILVLGDFSGRASRGIATTGPRKTVLVDRDNFGDVLESLGVQVRLPLAGGSPLEMAFHDLDSFHPDSLFQRLPIFKKIRDLRDQLDDPATFPAAARELGVATSAPKAAAPQAPPPPPRKREAEASLLSGSLLDQALEATEARGAAAPARAVDPMAHYLQTLVGPHLTPKPDPKKKEVMQQVDEATSGVMRGILHNPLFQGVEAAWRALYFLIKELETGPMLKVYLLDISRQEMEADLGEADDLRFTTLYRVLVEETVRTPGAHPWAAVVGAYTFGPDMADLNVLGRMALLMRQAEAPFLACGSPKLLACNSIAKTPYPEDWKSGPELEGWNIIRSLPEARYLGLTLPRFLLRLPYGKTSEATEAFDFEEMPGVPEHESYLWGNSAFLCAYLLGQMFTEFGWSMQGDEILTLRRLPIHVYKENGEGKMTPSSEVFLSQSAMEKIHDAGLMCLMSFANSDEVRLAGFRSASADGRTLLSRWG